MFKEGGQGSGNFGHAGRPGQVGGSISLTFYGDILASDNDWAYIVNEEIKRDYSEGSTEALKFYTGSGFSKINNALRGKDAFFNRDVQRFVDFTDQDRKDVNRLVTDLDKRFDIELGKDMTVYRTTFSTPSNFQEGFTFKDLGYVSTTLMPSVAFENFGRGNLFRIHLKKGQKVSLGNTGEREIILPRNSTFKIVEMGKYPIQVDNITPEVVNVFDLEVVE